MRGENRRGPSAQESDALLGAVGDAGKADDGVVAMATRELGEHRALGRGEFGAGQQLVWPQIRLEQGFEKIPGANASFALAASQNDRRIERERDGGIFRRRIGEREAAAERAAVADRRVRDMGNGLREKGYMLGHLG